MARVNVEQSAFTDPRFSVLGRIIGRDRWSALGRMAMVWNIAQERERYALSIDLVDALFDDIQDFAAAIVKAGLGRLQEDGLLYIAGAVGRVEWLGRKRKAARENGALGGRPKTDEQPTLEPKDNRDRFPAADPPAPATGSLLPLPAPAEKTGGVAAAPLAPALDGSTTKVTKKAREPKPTVEEQCEALQASDFTTYAEQIRFHGDVAELIEEFKLYYRSNGFRIGRAPMKDARSAFMRWLREETKREPAHREPQKQTTKLRTAADFGGRSWRDVAPAAPRSFAGATRLDSDATSQLHAGGHSDDCGDCCRSGSFSACAVHRLQAVTA
jgi:hypothetical protein